MTTATASEKTTNKAKAAAPKKVITQAQRTKGLTIAALSIPLGIVAWDILWNGGFIASIVAFGIAWLAVKLFTKTTGFQPDVKAAKALIAIIVAGVVLGFLSGIVMDINKFFIQDTNIGAFQALGMGDFWMTVWTNLTQNGKMWGGYAFDIIISVVFAFLGCRSIISELIAASRPQPATKNV